MPRAHLAGGHPNITYRDSSERGEVVVGLQLAKPDESAIIVLGDNHPGRRREIYFYHTRRPDGISDHTTGFKAARRTATLLQAMEKLVAK